MSQHTINLPCIKDTWIDESYPTATHGSDTTLKGGWMNPTGSNKRAKILLAFDWSNLPARKKITEIKLKFYNVNNLVNPYNCYFSIGPIEISWAETSNWNDLLGYSAILNSYLENTNVDGGQYFEITLNLTNALYQNRIINYGLVVSWDASVNSYVEPGYVTMQSREGSNPPILVVTYEDVTPKAPTPTEPIGSYKDNKEIVRFEWQYNSDVGDMQKAFDLQYSSDQTNWTTVSETTANNYYDMPADTLPAGNIYWRVRCYNEHDEVGLYCEIQSFYAIGAPEAPTFGTISTDTARPTITWAAFDQQAYQLQVMSDDDTIYDSGIVPGINIRSHKIAAWLADGDYTVQIRIKNEYDLWSEWGSVVVTISTVKPDKPTLDLQRSAHGVEINSAGLVYRSDYNKDNYICIGEASGTYYDNAVVSGREYKYFVRAISAEETFADSDIKFIRANFRHALIAPVSDMTNVFAFTRSLNSPPKRSYNRQSGGAFVEYTGRKSPVWEPTEHIITGWTTTFYLKTWDDVEKFTAICDLNDTVLYRDAKGRKMYGILNNLSVNDERGGYTVSFTLNEVDYNEEVEV